VKDIYDFPMILVGNKCDKVTEREVSREEGMNMARKLKCEFIESSARTCVNVERAFYTVVRMIRAREDGQEEYRKKKKRRRLRIRIKKPM
jgi:GTPase KRas protein